MNKTFEDYLEDKCFEENPTVLDDDMPDYFDNWISNLEVSEVMIYADGWMAEYRSKIRMTIHEITKMTKRKLLLNDYQTAEKVTEKSKDQLIKYLNNILKYIIAVILGVIGICLLGGPHSITSVLGFILILSEGVLLAIN